MKSSVKQSTPILPTLRDAVNVTIAFCSVVLFRVNFAICSHFYDVQVDSMGWWRLRTNIYAVCFLMCYYIAKQRPTIGLNFIYSVGIGVAISDVVDRVFFDITQETKEDFWMVVLTFLFAIIEHVYDYRKRRRSISDQ